MVLLQKCSKLAALKVDLPRVYFVSDSFITPDEIDLGQVYMNSRVTNISVRARGFGTPHPHLKIGEIIKNQPFSGKNLPSVAVVKNVGQQ